MIDFNDDVTTSYF